MSHSRATEPSRRTEVMASPESELLTSRPKVVPVPNSGVVIFESRHAPGFVGRLKDDFSKFILVIHGRARWEGSGRVYLLEPDSLVHIPANVPHRTEDLAGAPVTLYAIHYRSELVPSAVGTSLSRHGMLHWNLRSSGINHTRQFRSDFQEMLFEQSARQDGWETVLRSRLLDVAVGGLRLSQRYTGTSALIFEKGKDSAERVAAYAARLECEFYRQQTIDAAALATGLSRRQFTDVFYKVTGTTWHRYLEKLRLNHARKLLLQSDSSIIAVAFESGFENLSNFHRVFKRVFGCAPSALRSDKGAQPDASQPGSM